MKTAIPLLVAGAACAHAFTGVAPRRLAARPFRVRHAPAPLRASAELVDAVQQQLADPSMISHALDAHLAGHDAAAWTSMTLADAVAAVEEGAKKGWFGGFFSFMPKFPDLWTPWREGVTAAIVGLHDVLYSAGVTENTYGFAIMLFTFLARSATLPLSWIQYSSTEKMKALKPYQDEIKERYSDEQTRNFMTAKLYEDTESNPLAGCIPSLVQIPVFIALYRSILNLANAKSLEEPFLFLPSLEGPTITDKLELPQGRGMQWLTEGWTGSLSDGIPFIDPDATLTPFLGWHDTLAYVSIPILLFIGQKISIDASMPEVKPDDDPATKRSQAILKYIPFMIGYFALQVPCGLGVYWLVSNTYSTSTSLAIKQYFKTNPPVIEWEYLEEQAKAGLNEAALSNMQLPANMEDAIAEAMVNARPSRLSKRVYGIAGGSLEMAAAAGTLPSNGAVANGADAADSVSVEELLGEKQVDAEIVA